MSDAFAISVIVLLSLSVGVMLVVLLRRKGKEAPLKVVPVPYCGWSDLGTPRRVADCLRRLPGDEHPPWFALAASAYLNLAAQHARQQMAS